MARVLERLLQQPGRGLAHRQPRRVEDRGVRIGSPEQAVGHHECRQRAVRQAPFAVARRDPERIEAGQQLPGVGHPVGRHEVVGRPAVREVLDAEALAREVLQRAVAGRSVGVLAGDVPLPTHDQELAVAVGVAAQRARRAVGRDQHRAERLRDRHADRVGAHGRQPREPQPAVQERHVRREHDALGAHARVVGVQPRRTQLARSEHAGALVDPPAGALDRRREAVEVTDRVQLGALRRRKRDRCRDRPRQRRVRLERRLQPGAPGGDDLAPHVLGAVVGLGVGVGRLRAPVAGDPLALHRLADPPNGVEVALAVRPRRPRVEAPDELGVDELVQRTDLGGRVPGDTGADAVGLQHHDLPSAAREGQRRGQAGDPPADDRHVRADVAACRRTGWWTVVEPGGVHGPAVPRSAGRDAIR